MIRFTKQEKIVLIFLLASLFVGTGALYYKRTHPHHYVFKFDERKIKNSKKIDINKAGKEELMRLKHVGPVLASRIISYREKHGPFERPEDIKNVKGIGQKTYEKLKKQIILE